MTTEPKLSVVAADPFDPAALRLDQSFTDGLAIEKMLTTVPVRKPSAQEWFRVHPGPDYRRQAAVIALKDDGETYVIMNQAMQRELVTECIPVSLYLGITRAGVLFIFPARLPGADGHDMRWWSSAREAAEAAMTRWTRMTANKPLGAYERAHTSAPIPDPQWPDRSFSELLGIAFRDYQISSIEHPVVKRLRGLA